MSEKRSLDAEPFAAAMKAQEPMSEQRRTLLGERLRSLADADRQEVVDHGLGEREIVWSIGGCAEDPGEWIALGYEDSGELSVTLLDPFGEPFAEWDGETARALLALGEDRQSEDPRHVGSKREARAWARGRARRAAGPAKP